MHSLLSNLALLLAGNRRHVCLWKISPWLINMVSGVVSGILVRGGDRALSESCEAEILGELYPRDL